MGVFAESEGSWSMRSYLKFIFDQFDVRSAARAYCSLLVVPTKLLHPLHARTHDTHASP